MGRISEVFEECREEACKKVPTENGIFSVEDRLEAFHNAALSRGFYTRLCVHPPFTDTEVAGQAEHFGLCER